MVQLRVLLMKISAYDMYSIIVIIYIFISKNINLHTHSTASLNVYQDHFVLKDIHSYEVHHVM